MVNPTEIVYWEVIPALRRELVFALKDLGLKQNEIAKYLEITPSAVSQYIKKKRGGEFVFDEEFKERVRKSASKLSRGNSSIFIETNVLIHEFEKSKSLCEVCTNRNHLDKNCNICKK